MMMQDRLRSAVRVACRAGAATTILHGALAEAQEAGDNSGNIATVVVTGTRILRADYEATSPMVTVNAAQLQQSGSVQIDSFLNQLPQLVPSLSTTSNNPSSDGGGGQALVDLRGLGVTRTLVLMDGTRLTPSYTNGQIDLNTIPSSLIENIEILTGGASSVYGSDAISGVVNVRLRKHFQGVQFDGHYGQTAESDGAQSAFDLTMGSDFGEGRGNAVLAFSYDDRRPVLQGDRDFSRITLGPQLTPLGSATIPDGRYDRDLTNLPSTAAMNQVFGGYGVAAGAVAANANLGFNSDGTLFDISGSENYRGEQFLGFNPASFTYNAAPVNYLQLPLTRRQVAGFGTFDVAQGSTASVEAYARMVYTTYEATRQLAATPITGLTIPATNVNIPDDMRILLDSRPNPAAPFTFRIRTVAAGERVAQNNYDVLQGLVGLRGDFGAGDRSWKWDVYGSWGQTKTTELQEGNISRSRIQGLLDGIDLGGCTAAEFNPFGLGNISAACAEAISIQATNVIDVEQQNVVGSITGSLFELPAGPFQVAVGAEYRKQSAVFRPDEFLASGDVVGFNAQQPQNGEVSVNEAFVELAVPLLKDVPLVHSLDAEFGYRYSDYNLAGGVNTYKAALDWAPVESFRVRGSYNRAVRAPSIFDLFLPPQEGFPTYVDPCNAPAAGSPDTRSQQALALCEAQGIPASALATFQQTNTQVRAISGGNPDVAPESADTVTAGIVWQPKFAASSLRTSIDYWQYDVSDTIGSVEAPSAISRCFNAIGANPSFDPNNQWCQLFIRLPSGEITNVQETSRNLGELKARGVDLQLDYGQALGERLGRLNVNLLVTRVLTWDIQEDTVSPFGHFAGTITVGVGESYPKWKGMVNLGWDVGQFGVAWNVRYVDSLTVVNNDAAGSPVVNGLASSVPSYDLHRFTAHWAPTESIDLLLGVDNVFDKSPPIFTDDSQAGQQSNTDPVLYDVLGRRYFATATFKF